MTTHIVQTLFSSGNVSANAACNYWSLDLCTWWLSGQRLWNVKFGQHIYTWPPIGIESQTYWFWVQWPTHLTICFSSMYPAHSPHRVTWLPAMPLVIKLGGLSRWRGLYPALYLKLIPLYSGPKCIWLKFDVYIHANIRNGEWFLRKSCKCYGISNLQGSSQTWLVSPGLYMCC